jgi:hypothetical protein
MVVEILVALVLFTTLLFFADRWASRCTTEDPITLAELREARRAARTGRRRPAVARVRPVELPRPTTRAAVLEPTSPARRPIQVVAADLRRLSRQLALVPSGSTLIRWKALWAAYDGVLVEAAEMLEVPHDLAAQPAVGTARDVERLRLLAALEGAGLAVRA